MKDNLYNEQKLTDYLLDQLPEAETERFDELSFIDDDFAEQLSAAEKDLVDAYVAGELSGETLRHFETYYLASPRRREKVEFARSFQDFAGKQLAAEEAENVAVAETGSEEKTGGIFSIFESFRNPRFALQFGFAAAVLLFLGVGGWLLLNNLGFSTGEEIAGQETPTPTVEPTPLVSPSAAPESTVEIAKGNTADQTPPPPTPTPRPTRAPVPTPTPVRKPPATVKPPPRTPPRVTIASFILTPPRRGNNPIKQLTVPANTETIAVRLELEFDEFTTYRVQLADQTGRSLWQSGGLKSAKSGGSGSLNLRFPANLLQNMVYTLNVSGIGTDGSSEPIAGYPFRVVLK